MTLPVTGPISLGRIAAEFGGTPPHSMREYRGAASGVPKTGALAMSVFRGKSRAFAWTITANQKELDLHRFLIAKGWDGKVAVVVTIKSGVHIWSDDIASPALDTGGTYPGGLVLVNQGFIMGKGGDGGYVKPDNACVAPTSGGPALRLSTPITIDNAAGYIGGGGGGGAASTYGGPGGGGAGGGRGGAVAYGETDNGLVLGSFGAPGAIGQAGSVATDANIWAGQTIARHGGAGGSSGASYMEAISS